MFKPATLSSRPFASLRGATALALAALLSAGPLAAQAFAASATPAQVVALAVRQDGKTPYRGTRSQQVIRQDMVLHATAKIDFLDNKNYQIAVTEPKDIRGLNLVLDQNHLTVYFPKETLAFQNDNPTGAEEAKDLITGKLTDDPALLARNYKLTLDPEMDIIALYPCYKLTLEPIRGLGPTAPPGRRVWVSKDNGVIMREERYWASDMASFFTSQFDSFSTSQTPTVKLTLPREVSKLKLAQGTPTSMTRYESVAAARAAGKAIYEPTALPTGFVLRAVDVMSLYGTDIVMLRYNDGLNNMVVTYRTKPNAFLTLMAGAFALSLVDKISQLSYHAPNNYAVVEKGEHYVYAYGDLWLDELRKVANSVPVPVTAPASNAPKQSMLPGVFASR